MLSTITTTALLAYLGLVSCLPAVKTAGVTPLKEVGRYSQPDYTSPFLGDRDRGRFLDSQVLVVMNNGYRRLKQIEVFCGSYLYEMTVKYEGGAGATNPLEWQYGSNELKGSRQSITLNPGEAIGYVRVDICDIGGGDRRVCYLEISKGKIGGGSTTDPNFSIDCGHKLDKPSADNSITVSGDPDYQEGKVQRHLLSFAATNITGGIAGMQTGWMDAGKY